MEVSARAAKLGCLWLTLPIIILFATAPLLSVIISSAIAENAGCTLHEGAANPCIIAGIDAGGTLYGMFVLGWFSFVTLPIGLVALLGWLIAVLVLFLRRRDKVIVDAQPPER